jgi:hypothetical protein
MDFEFIRDVMREQMRLTTELCEARHALKETEVSLARALARLKIYEEREAPAPELPAIIESSPEEKKERRKKYMRAYMARKRAENEARAAQAAQAAQDEEKEE